MFKLIGALVGLVLGDRVHEGFLVTLLFAGIGLAVGAFLDRRRAGAGAPAASLSARLNAIEWRLAALERSIGEAAADAPDRRSPPAAVPTAAATAAAPSAEPRAWTEAPIVTADDAAIPPRPAYGVRSEEGVVAHARIEVVPTAPVGPIPPAPARRSPWAWFTEGNTLTRVGVVILIFGVAFLLSWFADHLTL